MNNYPGRLRARADLQPFHHHVELYFFTDTEHGGIELMKPPEFQKIDLDSRMREPTLVLRMAQAQELMDELWRCGLRPSEGSGSAGALKATERHLEDMRSLVFNRSAK